MAEPFEEDELFFDDEWVEVSDIDGHKAALRHLATIRCDEQTYFVLGAVRRSDGARALMLVREEMTADGTNEHVIVRSEHEIERVVEVYVRHMIEEHLDQAAEFDDLPDEPEACGLCHLPGEFCYCDDPAYLQ